MIQLSKNLTDIQISKSYQAIEKGLRNNIDPEALEALVALAENIYEPLFENFNTIFILDGYISKELNDSLEYKKYEQHTRGQCLSIALNASGSNNLKKVFEYVINNLKYDTIIWEFGSIFEPDWITISYVKNNNRKRNLISYKDQKGNTQYRTF